MFSMSAPTAPLEATQQPPSMPEEKSGVTKVMWFGIIQLAGIAAGWALSFYVFGTLSASLSSLNLPPNPTPSEVGAAMGPLFQSLTSVLSLTFAMELLATFVLTLGLRDLCRVDGPTFSLPWKLMVVLMIGIVIAAAGLIPLFNALPSVIAAAPAGSETPSAAFFSSIGTLIFSGMVIVMGGILVVVGLIGGLILGLWRVGSRYDETVIKIGAILTVVPLLNLVAPILVLVGAYGVRGRLSGVA